MNSHGRANSKDPKSRIPLSLSSSGIAIRLTPRPGRLRLPCRHILVLGARGFIEDARHPSRTRHRLPAYAARAVPDVDRPIGRSHAIHAAELLESSAAVVMPIEASTRARAGHRDDKLRDDALPLTGAEGQAGSHASPPRSRSASQIRCGCASAPHIRCDPPCRGGGRYSSRYREYISAMVSR